MRLVAFVGPQESGKDTCALLAKVAGIVAGKIPFAGPLKRICSNVFGIPLEVFEHPEKKEEYREYLLSEQALRDAVLRMSCYTHMEHVDFQEAFTRALQHVNVGLTSPRQVLQYVGTEIIRAYQPDWHCRAAFSPLHLEQLGVEEGETYAVTDCRFLNEFDFLSFEHNTSFFYVERPKAEEKLAKATHPSETEIKEVRKRIKLTIKNTGTLDYLRGQVEGAAWLL